MSRRTEIYQCIRCGHKHEDEPVYPRRGEIVVYRCYACGYEQNPDEAQVTGKPHDLILPKEWGGKYSVGFGYDEQELANHEWIRTPHPTFTVNAGHHTYEVPHGGVENMTDRIREAYGEFMDELFGDRDINPRDRIVPRADYKAAMEKVQKKYGLEVGDPEMASWVFTLILNSPKIDNSEAEATE